MNRLTTPLYTVTERLAEGDDITFRLRLDAGCPVFSAHFPGNPIMPGACMVQTAVRLAADATKKRLRLTQIRTAKFLATVSPDAAATVDYTLTHISADGETLSFNATVRCGSTINAKMSLRCKILQEI